MISCPIRTQLRTFSSFKPTGRNQQRNGRAAMIRTPRAKGAKAQLTHLGRITEAFDELAKGMIARNGNFGEKDEMVKEFKGGASAREFLLIRTAVGAECLPMLERCADMMRDSGISSDWVPHTNIVGQTRRASSATFRSVSRMNGATHLKVARRHGRPPYTDFLDSKIA